MVWLLWTPVAGAAVCGEVLTADTTLLADVICPPGFVGSALTIGADGVTLDGGGHQVIHPGEGEAVRISGFGSVTVRNVDLSSTSGLGRGLLAERADRLTLSAVDLSGHAEGLRARGDGIHLADVQARDSRGWAVVLGGDRPEIDGLVVDGSVGGIGLDGVTGLSAARAPSLRGTRYGVYVSHGRELAFDRWSFDGIGGVALTLDRCDDCRISGSSFVGARTGIDVRGPHARLELVGNDLSHVYGGWAASVRGGVDDRIVDNLFEGSTFGLRLIEAHDVEIGSGNGFGTSGERALWVADSEGVVLSGLSLSGFPGTAITLLRCRDCEVRDSLLIGVGGGIEVIASDGVVLEGNDLSGARRFGIHLADSSGLSPARNTFDRALEGLISERSLVAVDRSNSFREIARVAVRIHGGEVRLDGLTTTLGGVVATGAALDLREHSACGEGVEVDGVEISPAGSPDSDRDGIPDPCDRCDDPDRDGACGEDDPCIGLSSADADGDRWCADTDCDDTDGSIHPGAAEASCNGRDDDCRPETEDAPDSDGDGFLACDDCDDHDPTTFPGAQETCDGQDDDCDRLIDDGLPSEAWFADADGDSYGDEHPVFTCNGPPAGHVGNHADCDDTRAAAHPGAQEIPGNGIDDDCNRYTPDRDGAT